MSTIPPTRPLPAQAPGPRRAYRDSREPILGGVGSGVARHLGAAVVWVRAGFVLAAALGGLGVVLYAALWAFLPADTRLEHAAPGLESATRTGRRPGRVRRLADVGPAVVLAALGLGALLLLDAVLGTGGLFWPLALGLAGVALFWRQADEAQRERWAETGRIDPVRAVLGGGAAAYARVAAGGALVLGALALVALRDGSAAAARDGLVVGLLGVAGLALVIGPWVLRLATDLTAERAERIRTQERADVAAHLHDSVLQTLALIQRNAADPGTVARLARAQERDLRGWLYAGAVAEEADATVAAALRSVAATVEDDHAAAVEVVTVGDAPLTDPLRPLVHATREAVTNAAKHAGTGHVDVYVEVSGAAVEVFVRDRGTGFALADVPQDRHGVRDSILARMRRHGGTAELRSTLGGGTEVRLRMPREEQSGD